MVQSVGPHHAGVGDAPLGDDAGPSGRAEREQGFGNGRTAR